MRAEGSSKTAKGKNRKTKKSPTKRLKIRQDKFSLEFKAKNKERLNKWKQKLLESVLQLLGDPRFNNADIENDLLYFQDLDLAIFGAAPVEYKMYANQLQKEYVHMDENTYKNMRLKILQTFLTIPNIFSTELLRNRFEEIARTNIKNEILELKN